MMNRWRVYTHLGCYETVAITARKAICNVRYRLRVMPKDTWSWEAMLAN